MNNREIASDIVHGLFPYIDVQDAATLIHRIELALDKKDQEAALTLMTVEAQLMGEYDE